MEQNSFQNNVSNLPNADLLIRAGEKFVDLHGDQIVVVCDVGVALHLLSRCY